MRPYVKTRTTRTPHHPCHYARCMDTQRPTAIHYLFMYFRGQYDRPREHYLWRVYFMNSLSCSWLAHDKPKENMNLSDPESFHKIMSFTKYLYTFFPLFVVLLLLVPFSLVLFCFWLRCDHELSCRVLLQLPQYRYLFKISIYLHPLAYASFVRVHILKFISWLAAQSTEKPVKISIHSYHGACMLGQTNTRFDHYYFSFSLAARESNHRQRPTDQYS